MKPLSASDWRPSGFSRPLLVMGVVSFPQRTSALGSTRASLASSQSHRSFPRPQPSARLQQLKFVQTRSGRFVSSPLLLTPRVSQERVQSCANVQLPERSARRKESLGERRMVPLYRLAVEYNKGVKLRQLVKGRAGLRDLLYANGERERRRLL